MDSKQGDEKADWFENYNLENIVTLVDVDKFQELMIESGFANKHQKEFLYLVDGLRYGFLLKYQGQRTGMKRISKNLPLTVGTKTQLWNKVMKEVKLK